MQAVCFVLQSLTSSLYRRQKGLAFTSKIKAHKSKLGELLWSIYKPSYMRSPLSSTFWLVCSIDVYFRQRREAGHRDKTLFVQQLLRGREQRQWRFSSMSHIVTLDCTEGHSQIRSSVLCSQLTLLPPWKSLLLWISVSLRFSLLTQKVFQRWFKEKYWEKHILLHNMKLNWDDRVVFSWV